MSMQRLSFEVTNACNLDCPHCMRDSMRDNASAPRHLPVEYVEKALVQAGRYGADFCVLTGGEPFLHPQIEEIAGRIVHHGYVLIITTNGTLHDKLAALATNPEIRKKLFYIALSLDGASADSNDLIRGKGHFREVMKAVSYLRSKNVPVGFKTAVNTVNAGEIEGVVNMANKLGAAFVEIIHLMPTPESVRRKLILPRDQWAVVDREVARLQKVYKIPVSVCTGFRTDSIFTQCNPLKHYGLHFDFKGNMVVCCQLANFRGSGPDNNSDVAGNIGEDDLWDLHSRQIELLDGLNRARVRKIKNNTVTEADHFPCIFCLKHFGKLEWLRKLDPQNEWLADDEPAAGMQDMKEVSRKTPEAAIT